MSLQVWLPLTGHLNNQGLSNVTVTNNGATVDNSGKIGKCYSFNGSSAKITNTLPATVSSSVGTLACWAKFNAFPQSASGSGVRWYSLIQLGALGGFATCRFGLYMEYTNVINISIDGSDTGKNAYTHSLSTNTWYHLCATYDGTLVKLYINGSQVMSKTATKGTYTTAASYLYCGATNNFWTNGYMNDIRYYDHALSEKEVKELSKGLILHYPLSQGSTNIYDFESTTSKWVADKVTLANYIDTNYGNVLKVTAGSSLSGNHRICRSIPQWTSGQHYTVSFLAKASKTATCTMSRSVADFTSSFTLTTEWKRYTGSIISTETATTGTLSFQVNTKKCDVYLTQVKLEYGDIATPYTPGPGDSHYSAMGYDSTKEYDVSGYNNHGTKAGTITYKSDSTRYSVAPHFINGSYIIANKNSPDYLPKDSITVNLWIRCTTWGNPISCTESGGFNFEKASSGGVGFIVSLSGVGYKTAYGIPVSNLTDGKWHMLTGVYDRINQVVNTYLDTQLMKTTATGSSAVISYAINRLIISGEAQSTTPQSSTFVGEESDVRIYATALSAEDIKELYNIGASLANNGTLFAYDFVEA